MDKRDPGCHPLGFLFHRCCFDASIVRLGSIPFQRTCDVLSKLPSENEKRIGREGDPSGPLSDVSGPKGSHVRLKTGSTLGDCDGVPEREDSCMSDVLTVRIATDLGKR